MVYGGDLARATHASAAGQALDGASGSYAGRSGQVAVEAATPTLSSISERASSNRDFAYERRDQIRNLGDRAAALVTRLYGSFPTPTPSKDPDNAMREPRSAIEAALRDVHTIGDPLRQMDEGLQTLSLSLDALERALG